MIEKEPNREQAVVISESSAGDAEGIAAVRRLTWLDTYPNVEHGITREDILSKDFSPSRLILHPEEFPESRSWVAKSGGEVVGFVMAKKEEENDHLSALYVLPEFHGKGIGGQLMNQVLSWLGGDKDVVLEVAAYNQKAIDFYKKFGFVEKERNESFKLPNGKTMPEVVMIRPKANIR